MQPIEIPDFQVLRGEEAVKALRDYIEELEKQKGDELTDKQTAALIKLAKGLISSIETETPASASDKDTKEMQFVNARTRSSLLSSARVAAHYYALPMTKLI